MLDQINLLKGEFWKLTSKGEICIFRTVVNYQDIRLRNNYTEVTHASVM